MKKLVRVKKKFIKKIRFFALTEKIKIGIIKADKEKRRKPKRRSLTKKSESAIIKTQSGGEKKD
jgi:hypothetical protein